MFVRLGQKLGWQGRTEQTVLLSDIRRKKTGVVVASHLWFGYTKGFAALDLHEGDIVSFVARVKGYEKGYRGRREDIYDAPVSVDYQLSRPTQVRRATGEGE